MTIPDERESKLPKWAQNALSNARREAREAQEELEASRLNAKTRIWYGSYQDRVYVPESYGFQRVHFTPHGTDSMRDDIQVGFAQRPDGPVLEVMGGDSLEVELNASNCFYVRRSAR